MHKRSIAFLLLVISCCPAIATAQGSLIRKGESATFGNLGVVVSEDVAAGSAGFSVSLAGKSDFGFAITRAIGSRNAEGWAMSQSLDGYVYRKETEHSEFGIVLTESASLAWGRNR